MHPKELHNLLVPRIGIFEKAYGTVHYVRLNQVDQYTDETGTILR